jgi:hypothetical protein
MRYFIIIWTTGWLLTLAWYFFNTLLICFGPHRLQRPEHRRRLVRGNIMEALFAVILWPLEAGMIVAWLLFNGRGRGR